ncbi:MAG: glycoside hydrolase [Actinobacteria bacterium]|nr:glycoside hydrolase [Actinomycetota bacterium]
MTTGGDAGRGAGRGAGDGDGPGRSAIGLARPVLALVAALLGAVGAVGAVLWLTADRDVVVEGNQFVNPTGPIDAHNSPSTARNPLDPDNLVVVSRVDRPEFRALLHWTVDGGGTWRTTSLPLPEGLDRPYAPDAAFTADGILYVTYVNLTGPGNVPDNLWIARSDDGGQSLTQVGRVAGELAFQARVVIAPDGAIHVTYLQATDVGTLQLVGEAPIVAVRSDDGGRTFSQPTRVSDPDRQRVGAASPVVDAAGDLVVVYQDFKGDVRDFQNLEGPAWDQPFALVVTRSGDRGRSFSEGTEIDSEVVPTERFLVFTPAFPSIAARPGGGLIAVWADGRNGDRDVFLRRSPDGRSWSGLTRVNNNPADDGTDQYLPQAAVSPDGRVDVVFYDRRRDPQNVMTDVFLASSPDADQPFRNVRVSSASFDSRVGPQAAPHLPVDFGSRLGLDSWDAAALAVWTDTRLGDEATGRQDLVAAQVRMPDRDALAVRRTVTLGALAGSVVALTAWWLLGARRRHSGA